MAADRVKTGDTTPWWEWIRYGILVLLLYAMVFREPLERSGFLYISAVLNLITASGFPGMIWLAVRDKTWRRFLAIGSLCMLLYAFAGMAGYRHYLYQSRQVTIRALEASVSFWIRLPAFALLFRNFPIKRFARHLAVHVCGLSALLVICTILDMQRYIWPRQVYRRGLGSIQIFYGHPSFLGAAAVLLLLFLLVLIPYVHLVAVAAAALIFPLFMTLRIRLWGFIPCVLILVFWFGILKKRLNLAVVLGGAAAGYLIGGRRFYDYYFSPYAMTMARGQFAVNGIRIAKDNFPFGTGFATFGSRAAQTWYSPVYYWYEMQKTPGLDPLWPSYACDTFWPMILGETGVLGLIGYLGLTILLLAGVLLQRKRGEWVYLTAMAALLFELLESTGALAFADPTAAGIALLLGLLFGLRPDEKENV